MSVADPWIVLFGLAALLLALGATSGLVNARLWISEPLICMVAGVLIGPLGLRVIDLDPGHSPQARAFFQTVALVTLAIAVLGSAVRLPPGWLRRHWSGLAVALGPGMLLMTAAGTAVAWATLNVTFLGAMLIGAILAPTDPVLSAPVVGGALARRSIPPDLRHAINAESGANDGLAQPLVFLPLSLIVGGSGIAGGPVAVRHWLFEGVLIEVGSAVVVGALAGYAARATMRWAAKHPDADRSSLLTIALALALAVLAGLQAIGGNGVLGAFIAGAVLNEAYDQDYESHQEHFNEAISRFFDLPVIFLLGAALPWRDWMSLGWRGAAFAIGILLLRRMPAWLALSQLMPWTRPWRHALFAGWFGPVGVAALFYACEAQDQTGIAWIWPVVSLAAATSVVAHGMTGTHLSHWLGRAHGVREVEPRRNTVPKDTVS